MGPIGELMGMMPGMNSKTLKQLNMDDRQINWTEAIINSMTENELNTSSYEIASM